MPFAAEPAPALHTGNASSTTLTIPFLYLEKSHVVVRQRTAADTALTTLVLNTDYSLTAAGDENGGTLTFLLGAPASGVKTWAWLDVPNTQETRFKQAGSDSAATKNADLDKIVQRIAKLEERLNRSFALPLSDTGSDMEGVVEKASLLGLLARFNSSTGKLEGVATTAFVAGSYSIPLTVANGGTASTTAVAARAALGLVIGTDVLAPNGTPTGSGASLTGIIKQGLNTIWVPAGAMQPRTTNGAAAGVSESSSNKVMSRSLDFDTTTQEFAQFAVRFPKNWNEGTVTAAFIWSAASSSGGVTFGLAGVALSDDDALDTAFGTAVTADDTLIATGDVHVSPTTAAITIAGTPAAGDWVNFQVNRTVANANDTLGADARLLGVVLFFTTDAGDDS